MSKSVSDLAKRMKGYEHAFRYQLPKRMPVILRVDGRAFHTVLAGCKRPFDDYVAAYMEAVALDLCEGIQGAQLAYVQSDEISVLIHNYKRFASESWFDNEVQKMCSIAASIATARWRIGWEEGEFDARVFVLPEADVCNYFLWRQQDATRNSISMLAQSLYSHKQLHGKNTSDMQEMCFQKGHNWNDLPTSQRRGRCVRRSYLPPSGPNDDVWSPYGWYVDNEIPIFSQNRDYINNLLKQDEE